jgi:hypothetical protein
MRADPKANTRGSLAGFTAEEVRSVLERHLDA